MISDSPPESSQSPMTVPGNLESLDDIAKHILAVAATAGLDKKATYKLRLAVDEIATNIIIYGYEQADRTGAIAIHTEMTDTSLTVVLEDTGAAFNPVEKELQEEETIDLPLEQRAIGGLGIYLAIQGVDRFIYERTSDRNRNTFVVNRP